MPAWLSLGANLGNPVETLSSAIKLLIESPAIDVISVSRLYRSAPVGHVEQPSFVNQAVKISTTLSPHQLMERTLAIEQALGRVKRPRWHEREIDIDILMFGSRVIEEDNLTIPHARMAERSFVLDPLAEIDPRVVHPVHNSTILELRDRLVRAPGEWIEPIIEPASEERS